MFWKEHNRHVKKGEKALWLCMPYTSKGKRNRQKEDAPIRVVNAYDVRGEPRTGQRRGAMITNLPYHSPLDRRTPAVYGSSSLLSVS